MDNATQGILEVARDVVAELDLDVVLRRVLQAAQELTSARYAALGVLDEKRTELARFITRGIDEQTRASIGELPCRRGLLSALIDDPRPLRTADVGRHPLSYGFPHGHPPMRSFLGVPILVEDRHVGSLYLTEKLGASEFSDEDEQATAMLAELAGIAIGHAPRHTRTRNRRDELERSVTALEATTQIARALGGETDPDVVLELVAKRGRALASARALVIELVRGEELEVAAAAGELPADILGQRLALEDTVAAEAMRSRRVQRLERAENRLRLETHGLELLGFEARAGLVVPLVFGGEAHGVLVVVDKLPDGPDFTADDERLLEAFATSAAIAVATAHAVVAERRRQRLAAAEDERRRWARELHDETLQSMGALRLALAAAGRSQELAPLRAAVLQAAEQLEQTIADLRALITDLRPAALDQLGLEAAIEALAERSARHGLQVDVSFELGDDYGPARRLDGELETTLYRVTQEALTNANKHGGATRAAVEIGHDTVTVTLSVRDDGAGFDPETRSDGFGLVGMRERIALLGGELRLDSTPGNGAIVTARMPLRVASGAAAANSRQPPEIHREA
ncbi:MAG: GAF domain-containing sensor histidine kinase [Solirubrobacteraceae bacterium]